MTAIIEFMTSEEASAYATAASLAAAGERDRKAWNAACAAEEAAKERAIKAFAGEVKLNRYGNPSGGVHPALRALTGWLNFNGCYSPA